MIAVVTGSSGFIGGHLVRALVAGGATVRVLRRPQSPATSVDARVELFIADLLDRESVSRSAVWSEATHVFHVAGQTRGRTLESFRVGNVAPTANILAAMGLHCSAAHLIYISSQAAAGPSSHGYPINESNTPAPIEDYGRSKLEAEQLVASWTCGAGVTIMRPAAVYGPGDRDFLRAFREATRRVGFYAARRHQRISLVHVNDLVRAILLAADASAGRKQTYFVANERAWSWSELYTLMGAAARRRGWFIQVPPSLLRAAGFIMDRAAALTGRTYFLGANRVAMALPSHWICDSSLIRAQLGWREAIPLPDGIRQTHDAYVSAGWLRRGT